MRLFGFILGVLLIFGLIRVFFPFDVNLSSWMVAWKKSSDQVQGAVPPSPPATLSPRPVSQQTPLPQLSRLAAEAQRSPSPTPGRSKKWQPFWKPFSTRGSAQGFARNIAEKTGLEVEPRRVRPGLYEVVFSYGDEEERVANARLIEHELGLKLKLSDPGP